MGEKHAGNCETNIGCVDHMVFLLSRQTGSHRQIIGLAYKGNPKQLFKGPPSAVSWRYYIYMKVGEFISLFAY